MSLLIIGSCKCYEIKLSIDAFKYIDDKMGDVFVFLLDAIDIILARELPQNVKDIGRWTKDNKIRVYDWSDTSIY